MLETLVKFNSINIFNDFPTKIYHLWWLKDGRALKIKTFSALAHAKNAKSMELTSNIILMRLNEFLLILINLAFHQLCRWICTDSTQILFFSSIHVKRHFSKVYYFESCVVFIFKPNICAHMSLGHVEIHENNNNKKTGFVNTRSCTNEH